MMRRWCYTSSFLGRLQSRYYSQTPEPLQDWAIRILGSRYAGMLTRENELAMVRSITSVKFGRHPVSDAVRTRWKRAHSELEPVESFARGNAVFLAQREMKSDGTVGNSIVFVSAARFELGSEATLHPAILDEIVQARRSADESDTQIYVLARPFKKLSQTDATRDVFRHPLWQELGCKMAYWSTHLPALLPATDVVCHAARCQYRPYKEGFSLTKDAYIFINLDRVRHAQRSRRTRKLTGWVKQN